MDRFLEYIILHEKEGVKYDKDCVLLLTDIPLWETTLGIIKDEDLYIESEKYGKENEQHITLLYGLLTGKYNDDDVEKILSDYTKINFSIKGIGIFENPDKPYDVVKFDIVSDDCGKVNEALKQLPYENDFPDYHPHMTLAYVKKGLGNKYKKDFSNVYDDYSTKVKLSKSTGEKVVFDLMDNMIQQEITTSAMIAAPPGDYSFYQKEKDKPK
jgi:2'-5' RNA ligase